jgi:hypothetical protein
VTLNDVLQEMLREKGVEKDAAEWVVEDIGPRLSFLDGSFPLDTSMTHPGMTSFYAMMIRKALDELITMEIELYRERSRANGAGE